MALITAGTGGTHATLAAAKAAASSGDTISVLSGTFNETNLAKNGVSWYFYPGTKVIYTGASAVGIFDDGGAAMTFTVGGFGHFENNTSGVDASMRGCVSCGHASSVIIVEGFVFSSSADDSGGTTLRCDAGFLSVKAHDKIVGDQTINTLFWTAGEMHVSADRIICLGQSSAIWCLSTDPTVSANMYVRCNHLDNQGAYGVIILDAVSPNFKLWVEGFEFSGHYNGGAQVANVQVTGGKLYFRASKLNSIETTGLYMTGGEVWFDVQKMTCDLTSGTVGGGHAQHVWITGGILHDFNVGSLETVGTSAPGNHFDLLGGKTSLRGAGGKLLTEYTWSITAGAHDIEGMRFDGSNKFTDPSVETAVLAATRYSKEIITLR